MLSKIEHAHRPKPLDPILDLVDFLNKTLKLDYMIAGGFPRDWYIETPFNDVDIYLDLSSTYIKDTKTLVKILRSTKRFEITKEISNRFVETIFCDSSPFTKGRPKHRVQFIMWYSTHHDAISNFDFEHCKFFIPIINQDPRSNFFNKGLISGEVYTHPLAKDSLAKKELILTPSALQKLEKMNSDGRGLSTLEIFIKRTLRFMSRGFLPTLETKNMLLEATENYFTAVPISDFSGLKSILLDEAEDYDDAIEGISIYKESEVARNLIANLLLICNVEDRARLLTSPCNFLRDNTLSILQDFPELSNGV